MTSSQAQAVPDNDRNPYIPYAQSGEIDWNTLGNILTAHMLGEDIEFKPCSQVLCISYIDPKYGRMEKGFDADTDWELAYESRGIEVFQRKRQDPKFFVFLSRGVVNIPLLEVAELLKRIESSMIWDKFLVMLEAVASLLRLTQHVDSCSSVYVFTNSKFPLLKEAKHFRVLSQSDTHMDFLGYHRYEAAQCFTAVKRDSLFFKRCTFVDGKYVITGMSVEDPDYPPLPGIKRAKLGYGSGFVLESYGEKNSKTLVTYMGNMGVKGIPTLFVKQAFRFHPMGIRRVQKHFKRLQQEKDRQEEKEACVVPTGLLKAAQGLPSCSSRYYEEAIPISYYTQRKEAAKLEDHHMKWLSNSPQQYSLPSSESESDSTDYEQQQYEEDMSQDLQHPKLAPELSSLKSQIESHPIKLPATEASDSSSDGAACDLKDGDSKMPVFESNS